jgi:hypothetical protein
MTTALPPPANGYPTLPPSGPLNPSPTAELTALAAHLRRLADRVDALETRYGELTAALTDTVLPQLTDLREHTTDQLTADQLTEHTSRLQQLLDDVTAAAGSAPIDWPTLDAEQAATAWDNLAHWITHTLVPWHEITRDQLPDCWALHRPAVIQLSWLHHTHKAAHRPGATGHLVADWHTRWLPAALSTITAAIPRHGTRTCAPGQHLANSADGFRNHPRHPVGQPSTNERQPMPGTQLAERHHWQDFYTQGKAADLHLRAV